MSRKLATVRLVDTVAPIENADRIELIRIDNWQCVAKKGEFVPGDKCVFFEPDSVLPEDEEWAQFMKPRKFRVKTAKFRGVYSQGLALPLDTIGISLSTPAGTDLTKTLGVYKYDPEWIKEKRGIKHEKEPVPHKWMLKFSLTRKLHRILYPKIRGTWPQFATWSIPKTDEERIQNIPDFNSKLLWSKVFITEKLDGQSCTIFYKRDVRVELLKRGLFGVCSRRVWYKTPCECNWWHVAKKNRLHKKLPEYCKKHNRSLAIQGEIIGPGIQGNRYKRISKELFVFQIYDIDKGTYLPISEVIDICCDLGLKTVPLIEVHTVNKSHSADYYLEFADGLQSSVKPGVAAEGIVIRKYNLMTGYLEFSCKAISRRYLLEKSE